LVGLALSAFAIGCDQRNDTVGTDRDNTAVNERDADGANVTPIDQSNEQADIDLVADIRARVLEIDDLSVNGRNVKIITNAGKVLLRGPVASAAERDAIAKVAADLAGGQNNVNNELEVQTR
jgi:osmotically-inducible protein OsmY